MSAARQHTEEAAAGHGSHLAIEGLRGDLGGGEVAVDDRDRIAVSGHAQHVQQLRGQQRVLRGFVVSQGAGPGDDMRRCGEPLRAGSHDALEQAGGHRGERVARLALRLLVYMGPEEREAAGGHGAASCQAQALG